MSKIICTTNRAKRSGNSSVLLVVKFVLSFVLAKKIVEILIVAYIKIAHCPVVATESFLKIVQVLMLETVLPLLFELLYNRRVNNLSI